MDENLIDQALSELGLLEVGMTFQEKKELLQAIEISKSTAGDELQTQNKENPIDSSLNIFSLEGPSRSHWDIIFKQSSNEKDKVENPLENPFDALTQTPDEIVEVDLIDSDDSSLNYIIDKNVDMQIPNENSNDNKQTSSSLSNKRTFTYAFNVSNKSDIDLKRKYNPNNIDRFPFYLHNRNLSESDYSSLFIKHSEILVSLAGTGKIRNKQKKWAPPIYPAENMENSEKANNNEENALENTFQFRKPKPKEEEKEDFQDALDSTSHDNEKLWVYWDDTTGKINDVDAFKKKHISIEDVPIDDDINRKIYETIALELEAKTEPNEDTETSESDMIKSSTNPGSPTDSTTTSNKSPTSELIMDKI